MLAFWVKFAERMFKYLSVILYLSCAQLRHQESLLWNRRKGGWLTCLLGHKVVSYCKDWTLIVFLSSMNFAMVVIAWVAGGISRSAVVCLVKIGRKNPSLFCCSLCLAAEGTPGTRNLLATQAMVVIGCCFAPRFWVLLGLKTHQENNVDGIYQLFLNYFNVTISNFATAS